MNQRNSRVFLERSIDQYIRALDSGDLDEIAAVLQVAEENEELDKIIQEVNWAYAEEMGRSSISLESTQVRALLQQHFSSVFEQNDDNSPITVSEVAAHLVANRLVPPSDQENSQKLLSIHDTLPGWLSLPEVSKFIQNLGIEVSDRFFKMFREAAIQMSMGRGQTQMAATRRKQPRQYPHSDAHVNENNNDEE